MTADSPKSSEQQEHEFLPYAAGSWSDQVCRVCGRAKDEHANDEPLTAAKVLQQREDFYKRQSEKPQQARPRGELTVRDLRIFACRILNDHDRELLQHAADLIEVLSRSAIESSDTAKVVRDNLPYLENLILPHGHESPLLRQHPAPCQGHDFCLMHQAQKGADAIRVALDSASADNRNKVGNG